MIRDYNIETQFLAQSRNKHTLGHLTNIEDIINPKEALDTPPTLLALYPLSMNEVEDLERRTHPSRKQAFKDRKYDWQSLAI